LDFGTNEAICLLSEMIIKTQILLRERGSQHDYYKSQPARNEAIFMQ